MTVTKWPTVKIKIQIHTLHKIEQNINRLFLVKI